jgi:hypothetical protein
MKMSFVSMIVLVPLNLVTHLPDVLPPLYPVMIMMLALLMDAIMLWDVLILRLIVTIIMNAPLIFVLLNEVAIMRPMNANTLMLATLYLVIPSMDAHLAL